MKVTFIIPCVGRRPGEPYHRSWLMEPLSIAVLASLTPARMDRVFYDDRLERIPFDESTDLVAISVETYSARRAYQIAARFRARGVRVVMGGFHATLVPDEVAEHADSVVTGEAEEVWGALLEDAEAGRLRAVYHGGRVSLAGRFPDRSIYLGKKYLDLALVESGRGCSLQCEFCSVTSFFNHTYRGRPIEDVVEEVRRLPGKTVFFTDDNLTMDVGRAKELFRRLAPLRKRWVGQTGIGASRDDELLRLMRDSGCVGVLVGIESLDQEKLSSMGKYVNAREGDYGRALAAFARHNLAVYGTFVFGYDRDTAETFDRAYEFALRHKLFFAAFNHLVPFPGTPLYARLQERGMLLHDHWWLSPEYHFGDVAFVPEGMTPDELARACYQLRDRFYGVGSVARRALNVRGNCSSPWKALLYVTANFLSGGAVRWRQGLPLGIADD